MADTRTMSTAPPQDIAAFQVFIWNRRRYAVPVNAQGEQLGPPLPFRNINRHKRKGYGPGSCNTDLLEDSPSSPLLSPLEPLTGMAAVAPPPSFSETSYDSDYSGSSQGRSSRQRLSRSVSFVEKKPDGTATESATAGGSTGAAAVLAPALTEPAPASILQKKSSFRVALRPLFDFDFEPPHTPPASASRRSTVKSKEDESKEKPEITCNQKTTTPGAGTANIAATSIPVHHHPFESFPSISPQSTTHVRPRTPPPVTLHSKSDTAARFPRTDCCVSHVNNRSNKSSLPAGGSPAAPLIPLELRHRPLSDSFPPQPFASPSSSPTKAAKNAAASPSMLAATAAPTEQPPTTAAGEASGAVTSPASPPRSPSPSKAAVAFAHTTARSPSPNDFSFVLRYKVDSTTPQGEVKVAAATGAAAAVYSPSSPPSSTFICICPKVQLKHTASSKAEGEKPKSHRGRRKEKGGAGVGRCATASLSKDTLPKEEKAEKLHEIGNSGKTPGANNSSASQQAAKPPTPVHQPAAYLAEEDAADETAEVPDDESLAPKYSDFLLPSKVTAVAAPNTRAAATAATRADSSIFVDKASTTAASGAATAKTTTSGSSARTGKAQKDQPTAHHRSASPNPRYSPELNASSESSALGDYVEDRRRANASPCARSNGDLYDLYRYAVLKPATPTKMSATTSPASGAPKPLSTPLEEKKNEADTAAAVLEPQLPSGSATSYDYQCSLFVKATPPTKPKVPRAAPPAPLRRHPVGDPCQPHIAHFSPRAPTTSLAAKEWNGREGQAMYNRLGVRVLLPPLSSRGPGRTGAESPQERRHTAPQVVPVPTQRQQQPPPRQRSATVPVVAPAAVVSPPTVFSSSSDEDSQPSVSHEASTVTTATASTSSRSTFDADASDERSDGQSEDAGSAASFSYGNAQDEKKEEWHSGSSCASESPTPTSDSKTTATTSTSATTTSNTTSDVVEHHHGSIWSSMMRRLRQPLIAHPTAEGDTLLYQLNRYRNRRTPEKSRVLSGSRVETVWTAGSRLSSVEMAGPADPLQQRRRMKKEPYSEAAAARKK